MSNKNRPKVELIYLYSEPTLIRTSEGANSKSRIAPGDIVAVDYTMVDSYLDSGRFKAVDNVTDEELEAVKMRYNAKKQIQKDIDNAVAKKRKKQEEKDKEATRLLEEEEARRQAIVAGTPSREVGQLSTEDDDVVVIENLAEM